MSTLALAPGFGLGVHPSPLPPPAVPSAVCSRRVGHCHSPHWPAPSPLTPRTAPCHPMNAGTAMPKHTKGIQGTLCASLQFQGNEQVPMKEIFNVFYEDLVKD